MLFIDIIKQSNGVVISYPINISDIFSFLTCSRILKVDANYDAAVVVNSPDNSRQT